MPEDSRFALVLEDLAPAEQGDQLRGCRIDQAQSAVGNLAIESTARFIEHYGPRVSEADASVLRAFAERSGSWLRERSERFAPIHGDYRLAHAHAQPLVQRHQPWRRGDCRGASGSL